MVKDADELKRMADAAALGNRVFHAILPHIQSGVPETEIAASLEFFARSMGAEGMSFETIVASGPRSALPHGRASSHKTPRNGFVTLDFGVILKGYCSDMTRTVCVGKAGAAERSAYDAVLEAQEAAVAAVKPGVTCGEVDEAARGTLRRAGLAKYFTHSTGPRSRPGDTREPARCRGTNAGVKAGHGDYHRARNLYAWQIRDSHRRYGCGYGTWRQSAHTGNESADRAVKVRADGLGEREHKR